MKIIIEIFLIINKTQQLCNHITTPNIMKERHSFSFMMNIDNITTVQPNE